MTPDSDDRFRNELLSLTTANPGWHVHVEHVEFNTTTKKRDVTERKTFPIIAWALARVWYTDGGSAVVTEPVFVTNVGPSHTSHYRWVYSELDSDSDPQVSINITIQPPPSDVADNDPHYYTLGNKDTE